jgi:hypothetical protein
MITKSKTDLLVFLLVISSFRLVTHAAKYNNSAYGSGVYSGAAADETDSCTKSDPKGDIRLKSLSPGDTHIKAKFTDMEEPYNKFEIKWGVSKNLSEYYLESVTFDDTGNNSYTIEDLSPDTLYYVKIRAINGCNKGNWSDTKSVKTLPVSGVISNTTSGFAEISNITTTPREDSGINAGATSPSQENLIQDLLFDLTIKVVDEKGEPINEAEVLLLSPNITQITNTLGSVTFTGISVGKYEVKIKKDDLNANTIVDINDPKVKSYEATVVLSKARTTDTESPILKNPIIQGTVGVSALSIVAFYIFKKFFKNA